MPSSFVNSTRSTIKSVKPPLLLFIASLLVRKWEPSLGEYSTRRISNDKRSVTPYLQAPLVNTRKSRSDEFWGIRYNSELQGFRAGCSPFREGNASWVDLRAAAFSSLSLLLPRLDRWQDAWDRPRRRRTRPAIRSCGHQTGIPVG